MTTAFGCNRSASVEGVARQPDGKIVLAGAAWTSYVSLFALSCYNGDGPLDPSFGENGKVTTAFNSRFWDEAYAVAL